jgi:hypothetical protein
MILDATAANNGGPWSSLANTAPTAIPWVWLSHGTKILARRATASL